LVAIMEGPSTAFVLLGTTLKRSKPVEFSRPTTYLGKLQFAQRTIKAAQFRSDPKQSLRELCEGLSELLIALIDREEGREVRPEAGQPEQKPAP